MAELLLLEGKKVLLRLEIPGPESAGKKRGITQEDLEKLVGLYAVSANRKRLEMMLELQKVGGAKFTDLLRVGVNPKLVGDFIAPMVRLGLVEHEEGREYRLSKSGSLVVPILTSWFNRLLDAKRSR